MKTTTRGILLLGMSVALLAAGLFVGPSSASAATITITGMSAGGTAVASTGEPPVSGGGTTIDAIGTGTSSISGNQNGTSALTYAGDWLSFTVTPISGGMASVTITPATPYANSFWQIGTAPNNASVTGPNPSTLVAVNVVLQAGTTYYLQMQADDPPQTAAQSFGITVRDVPETTSTFTFLGIGLVGMLGLAAIKGASQEA